MCVLVSGSADGGFGKYLVTINQGGGLAKNMSPPTAWEGEMLAYTDVSRYIKCREKVFVLILHFFF